MESQVITTTEYDYQFLDSQLYPEIEKLEKHRFTDASGKSDGNQCMLLSDCPDCSNNSTNTRRQLYDADKLILELVPFKLLSFDIMGQDVEALLSS
jgi:hypothetical protein